ncbi:hypothetical protein HZS92_00370 [Xanthomonas citri pv. citri]|nr:hypothetical protein HZS92_00370 [Xanthomonas citri pv. citri]QYF43125.1 hypothetical protein HZS93_00370 [Xanthomonas citri]
MVRASLSRCAMTAWDHGETSWCFIDMRPAAMAGWSAWLRVSGCSPVRWTNGIGRGDGQWRCVNGRSATVHLGWSTRAAVIEPVRHGLLPTSETCTAWRCATHSRALQIAA